MANFTPQQIEEFLQEFFDVVGARQYVGARYVPIFGRAGEETIEWDGRAPYEPLTVVMHDGISYVSRRYVPTGIQVTDTDYWAQTYRFNAQVEQYRQEVLAFSDRIMANTAAIEHEHDTMLATVDALRSETQRDYVPFPDDDVHPKYGTSGQVLSTLANGDTLWVDPVVPSDEQAEAIITDWLNDHPEATTTVVDGSITWAKLATAVKTILASTFDPTAAYKNGQIVVHEGVLYKYVMDKAPGAWDSGYCVYAKLGDEIYKAYAALRDEMLAFGTNPNDIVAYVPYKLENGVYDHNLNLNTGVGGNHLVSTVKENTSYLVSGKRWAAKSYPVAIFMHDDTLLGFTDENVAIDTRFTDVRITTPPTCNKVFVNGIGTDYTATAPLIQEVVPPATLAGRGSIVYPFDTFTIPVGVYDSAGNLNTGAGAHIVIPVQSGDVFRVRAYKFSNSYPIALFKNSGAFVGYTLAKAAPQTYECYVSIPTGVDQLIVQTDSRYNLDVRKMTDNTPMNTWAGKDILWLGTSISAAGNTFRGSTYTIPSFVGMLLNATVHNEAKGESMLRRGYDELITETDPYGWTGLDWRNVFRSLMTTLAEKQDLIDNYDSKWKALLSGSNPPAAMTPEIAADIRTFSFESKVMPYLDGTNPMPDMIVIEHGRNDVPIVAGVSRDMPGAASVNPDQLTGYNRSKYGDAMAYLIRLIRQYDKNVPIVIVGHFDNTGMFELLPSEQEDAATYNGVYYCDTVPLGWNNHKINVTGYWSSQVWIEDGTPRVSTRLNQCLSDGVHPSSDRSGAAIMSEAELIATYLLNNVKHE